MENNQNMKKNNEKIIYIAIALVVVILIIASIALSKVFKKEGDSNVSNKEETEDKIIKNDDSFDSVTTIGIGEETTVSKLMESLSEESNEDDEDEVENKDYKIENLDTEGVIVVDDNTIKGVYDGEATIRIYNDTESYNVKIIVSTETSNASVNENIFETVAKIKMPIPGSQTVDEKSKGKFTSTAQDFDIDGNYIYLSVPKRGVCTDSNGNNCHPDLKTVRIYRFTKNNNGQYDASSAELHTLLNSGHGTALNVITYNNNQYMLTGVSSGIRKMSDGRWLGASSSIAMVTFNPGYTENLANRSSANKFIPKNTNNKNLNYIDSIGLDETNKKLAITSKSNGVKQCVYNYSFKNNKLNLGKAQKCYKLPKSTSGGVQGTEYNNGKAYVLSNTEIMIRNSNASETRYFIGNALLSKIHRELPNYNIEPEGIKVINGNVYIGVRASLRKDVYFYIFKVNI